MSRGRSRHRSLIENLEPRWLLTTYYVSPGGSDSNAGTSTTAPWATVTKVDATTFSPGDNILFQRGGEWHGLLIASASGTAAASITYGDYGTGTKPTFDGSDVVPNSSFTAITGTTYSIPISSVGNGNTNAYWVYANHTALLAATSLSSVESNPGSFYVDGTNVDVNTGTVSPSGSNVYTLGDRGAGTNANSSLIDSNGFSYVTFNNLIGRETAEVGSGGSLAGGINDGYVYRIQGGSNVTLTNIEGYYGSKHIIGAIDTTAFLCNGAVFQGAPAGVSGNGLPYGNATATVSYADASQNAIGDTHQWINVTVSNYDGAQPGFLTHNDGATSMKSILLQNFQSLGSPIALQPGTNVAITIKGGAITNNTLTAYTSTGTTELIDGLSVTGNYGFIQVNGNATVQNCLITNANQPAIAVNGANNIIRFNTIDPYGYSTGIGLDYQQSSVTATNEKIYGNLFTGSSNAIHAYQSGDTFTADYDFFDSTVGAPSFVVGSTTDTLATFQASGYETHSVTGNPQFTNAASGDFSLQSTSPAINIVPTSVVSPAVTTDIRGYGRPSANIYDAGAYEYQSVLHQPTIATAAAANPNPVTGTTTNLSVLGASQDGEGTLIYTWATTGTPPAGVTFSANGTNAAKNTTATFTKAGTYNFQVTASNGQYSVTSSVTVTVNQTVAGITLTPATMLVAVNTTQQYSAAVVDQFGNAITSSVITYGVTGGGTITSSGLFTAPSSPGTSTITASSGTQSTTATATVTPPNQAPTVATAASASPNPVTSTNTTTLSVLGADDNGESNLTYTWSLTGTPPASVTFSLNGSNAAKNTVATFTANGTYNFLVTITDSGGLSTTSTVTVTVSSINPITVDGSLDASYGSPLATQTVATNIGSNGSTGVIGTGTKTAYTQLSAAYGVISESTGYFYLFLAGSLSLNNSHLNILIDSVPGTATPADGAKNLNALSTVSPYNNGSGFSNLVVDTGFQPDYIFTSAFGAGTSINYYNFDTGATGSTSVSDPSTTEINTGGTSVPLFYEKVNNAAVSSAVTPANAGSLTTGAEFAFSLAGLGYTAADYSAGDKINAMAIVTFGSFTQFSNQNLAPLNETAAGMTANGGGYFQGSSSPTDFSNAAQFPGNQFFAVAPPSAGPQAPTVATAATANPNPVTGTSTALSVLGADAAGESSLTYTWSLLGTPPAPVTFTANGTNAAKNTTATFTASGTYNFLVTITDPSNLTTTSSVTVSVTVPTAVTPTVSSFKVDDGTTQRSMVRTLTLTFNTPVTLDSNAIALTNTTTMTPITYTTATSDGGTTYVITPTSGISSGSLTDGNYSLVVTPSGVHSSSSPSTTGTGANLSYTFYRLFGDSNGDGTVNLIDYRAFVATYLKGTGQSGFSSIFDFNNDGTINLIDYRAFVANYLHSISM